MNSILSSCVKLVSIRARSCSYDGPSLAVIWKISWNSIDMDSKQIVRTSKFLSLVLRHRPDKIGIELDDAGWVNVDKLLQAIAGSGKPLSREQLDQIVRENDKQRFAFSEDGLRIRANQGHSIDIELDHQPAVPPEILLHGTPEKFVEPIRASGLMKMSRHHVHLHEDMEVADAVGRRRGKPVILTIRSGQMHADGHEFWVTPNKVWLVDAVPAMYIDFPAVE